jgi:alkylation response protein AidB-like acyl-CoA dehydrogenase
MDFDLTAEQKLWRETVHNFVAREVMPKAAEVDEREHLDEDVIRKMGAMGMLGLNVPEAYGGAGVDAISSAMTIEELGWACGSTALAVAAHNGLGCAALALFGSHELKEQYLPGVASGSAGLAALALTEPGAGSDLSGGVCTRARRDGSQWVIDGTKMWCTNASLANYIVTLVRSDSKGGSNSLSMILTPTDAPGLHIGPAEKKMGVKGSPANAVTYEQVRVPLNYLVGVEGHGLQQTLTILDGGRIGIGALAVGLAQRALDESLHYAQQRQAFGQALADFQAIQWMIADAATEIQAARLMVLYAAWLKDQRLDFSKQAAMAKLFATEMAERVCRNAIQIHGGYGYSREFPLERIYRDARLMTIGEGTSEIQRLVIARRVLQHARI